MSFLEGNGTPSDGRARADRTAHGPHRPRHAAGNRKAVIGRSPIRGRYDTAAIDPESRPGENPATPRAVVALHALESSNWCRKPVEGLLACRRACAAQRPAAAGATSSAGCWWRRLPARHSRRRPRWVVEKVVIDQGPVCRLQIGRRHLVRGVLGSLSAVAGAVQRR